jgi:hypothetical protein
MEQQVTVGVETITPEFARDVMARQDAMASASGTPVNRSVQRFRVENYARQMSEGRWQMNGVPVIFNGERMLDGQHRMLAVIRADRAVPMLVVRGVNTSAFHTIDVGKTRSTADVLSVRGITNTALTAAAAALVMAYERFGAPTTNQTFRFAQGEIADYVTANAERWGQAVHAMQAAHQVVGAPAVLTALSYLVAGHPVERVEFFARLKDGVNLGPDSPILHLRRVLSDARTARKTTRMHIRMAVTIKAWNAYIQKRSMRLLRWKDDEEFPRVIV